MSYARQTKKISHQEGDYREARFIDLRMSERILFPRGTEIQIEFEGRTVFEGFGMARQAAMIYAGLLTRAGRINTVPFISELGPYKGHVTGSQSPDGKQGWRIDCQRGEPKQFHVNWWDRRLDVSHSGKKARGAHCYGANFVIGGGQDLFWQIEKGFPGKVE